ncbi:hypothetical protein IH981_01895 [Patescibacteria group bacterium]|nr:hypothetical protein [Patescibacteria group bacterium]
MNEEDIIREICVAIPLTCPRCRKKIRFDRIDLLGISNVGWIVRIICGQCNEPRQVTVDRSNPLVVVAEFAVLGDRFIDEELRCRGEPVIPPDYERRLPTLLTDFWSNGPEEEPQPPRTLA